MSFDNVEITKALSNTAKNYIQEAGGEIIEEKKEGEILFIAKSKIGAKITASTYEDEIDRFFVIDYESSNIEAEIEIGTSSLSIFGEVGPLTFSPVYSTVIPESTIEFEVDNLLTGKTDICSLGDFIRFLDLLSLSKWPGTNVPIVLKYYGEFEIEYEGDRLIARYTDDGEIMEVSFATPLGKIVPYDKDHAAVILENYSVTIYQYPLDFPEFIHNYQTAINILNHKDTIKEFGIL